jgi:hypothetical protein
MSHPSVTGATLRVLALDRDPANPKWLLATVTLPADMRPVVPVPRAIPGLRRRGPLGPRYVKRLVA